LNFIKSCIFNNSSLVRAVTNYSIQYGRYNSILGHNILHCARLYDCSVQDIVNGTVNSIVNNYALSSIEDVQLQSACFVRELVQVRDNTLELSGGLHLSREELDELLQCVCAC
jgi:glycogen synthase